MAKIIIIDDEPAMVEVIVTLCREKGHQVFPFNSAAKAVEQMDSIQPQIVITDVKMETMSGFDVLRHVRENHRQTLVILITAYASVDTAIEAMKMGAHGYVPKPFKIDELQMTVQRALDYQSTMRENTYLRKELKNKYKFENIIGASRAMQQVYNLINKVADTDSTVLIQGESGTGKELVARGLHFNSNRQHQPFIAINCSALPENLLESELFGHKKGAFTGAVADKRGLFEEANLGTIFLDEVNSMATSLQTKLLRVLQEREVRRVGDNKSSSVNVRVVGATNEPLQPKMKDGTFREDLYYRLAVIPVEIPPLRERLDDVPLLVNHFLQKQASATGGEPKKVDPKAVDILCHYDYPGNVRELENAIERACALCDEEMILPSDLPPQIVAAAQEDKAEKQIAAMPVGQPLDEFIQQQERGYIEATLNHCNGAREKAASMLGISMATLYRKVEPKSKK
ncbi:MAG: sigma-54-dependent Fis family transcriptional regulator [Chthoniobacterales bacterium]|nr:sigma-54-dependent Fis family transcriptional regulator [Chthoniobacterales bacterium]